MNKVEIVVPGGCGHNIYAVIKQALESHGYVVNQIEEGCSTGDHGFLKRHKKWSVPKALKEPETIDLVICEYAWGG